MGSKPENDEAVERRSDGRAGVGPMPPGRGRAAGAGLPWFIIMLCVLCAPCPGQERFIAPGWFRTATVELRSEATVNGAAVTLRQVARWAAADAPMLDAAADLVVIHLDKDQRQHAVDLAHVKLVLEGAGINLAVINFSGAGSCLVTRSGRDLPERPMLMLQAEPVRFASSSAVASATPIAPEAQRVAVQVRSLRQLLIEELVERFQMPADELVVRFNPQDERMLNLSEPAYAFEIQPRRGRNLGDISWDIIITTGSGRQQVTLSAHVRAWQTQLVSARPVASRQVLADEDVSERRVLVDRLGDQAPLRKEQAVGQQAGRDIPPGMPISNAMIEAVQMVRLGELVTVTVYNGRVQLKWIAEAREHGTLGQSIRVRRPNTREEFSVMVTGPHQARLVGPAGDRVAGR
jgi:flagella basal body P-ring formation protein FlgA